MVTVNRVIVSGKLIKVDDDKQFFTVKTNVSINSKRAVDVNIHTNPTMLKNIRNNINIGDSLMVEGQIEGLVDGTIGVIANNVSFITKGK